MIRIVRSNEPRGHAARALAALARLREAVANRGGQPSRDDLEGVYKHDDVRQALWQMQHGKCAYCEREIEIAWDPVEHYRPFARYWWIAYSWSNLLAACNGCNSGGKGDKFPLAEATKRLQPEDAPPGDEIPLVLDPTSRQAGDDPEAHLTFVRDPLGEWIIAPRNGSPQGKETIEVCKLQRATLHRLRNKRAPQHASLLNEYRRAKSAGDQAALDRCRQEKAQHVDATNAYALLARVMLAEIR